MSIVITGASGNIGGHAAKKLLLAGEKVTIIVRDPSKVKDLVSLGAHVVQGDQSSEEVLTKAFHGAKSLYWLTPPIAFPDHTNHWAAASKLAAQKAKDAGIDTAVILSSAGAQAGLGSGVIEVLRDVENAFRAKLHNVAVLRPGLFYTNLFRDISTIVPQGAVYIPFKDQKYPFVAVEDIGDVVFRYLITPFHGQSVLGLHGPKDLTYTEVFETIGKVIGKQIKVIHVPVEAAEQGMKDFGIPEFAIKFYGAFFRGINDGTVIFGEPRTVETTTPTTLTEWAEKVFKPAYEAAVSQQKK